MTLTKEEAEICLTLVLFAATEKGGFLNRVREINDLTLPSERLDIKALEKEAQALESLLRKLADFTGFQP